MPTPTSGCPPPLDPGKLHTLLLELVSKIPLSFESRHQDPDARAREVVQGAAMRAAALSGALALPPGPVGFATIVPDLLAIWQIQKQMVADVAAIYGKTGLLTREMMVFCLFKHGSAMFLRDMVVRVGERLVVRRVAVRVLQRVLKRIGVAVTQQLIAKTLARWVPLLGALGVGGYAYYDTSKVGETAIDAFRHDIVIEG